MSCVRVHTPQGSRWGNNAAGSKCTQPPTHGPLLLQSTEVVRSQPMQWNPTASYIHVRKPPTIAQSLLMPNFPSSPAGLANFRYFLTCRASVQNKHTSRIVWMLSALKTRVLETSGFARFISMEYFHLSSDCKQHSILWHVQQEAPSAKTGLGMSKRKQRQPGFGQRQEDGAAVPLLLIPNSCPAVALAALDDKSTEWIHTFSNHSGKLPSHW